MPDSISIQVLPYLTVSPGGDFVDFCKRAFGFVEKLRMTMPGSDRLMHAEITLGGQSLLLSDEFAMPGAPKSPKSLGGTCATIHLVVPDVDATFKQAVAAGAIGAMP